MCGPKHVRRGATVVPVSTVKNPVGPEPPNTYWRRRAAVLGVLVVILLLGWLLLRAVFGSSAEPEAQAPSASPSAVSTASAAPEASADASPRASASPDTPASPSPTASSTCSEADIEVGAATAASSTSVGAGMGLTMTVTNTGDAACNRDVGAGANELRITSGAALVWSSDFCRPSSKSDVVALMPGEPFTTSVTWPGTVTAEDCPADQPLAQPGTYKAQARNGDVTSELVTFTVG